MSEFLCSGNIISAYLESPLRGGYLDGNACPHVHAAEGMAVPNGIIKVHPYAIWMARGEDDTFHWAGDDYRMG